MIHFSSPSNLLRQGQGQALRLSAMEWRGIPWEVFVAHVSRMMAIHKKKTHSSFPRLNTVSVAVGKFECIIL